MLTDLLQELEAAESIDEEDAVAARIRQYAREHSERFIQEVRSLPASRDSSLTEVYEALADDDNNTWGDFLFDEFRRLFDLAERDEDPVERLAPLDGLFTLCDDDDVELSRRFLNELQRRLRHENASIRNKCVWLYSDFLVQPDRSDFSLLEDLARSDPDWRVRVQAHRLLASEAPDRAKQVKLSLMDRLRARFGSVLEV